MVGRRHACEDNNKIDLKGAGCVNVNWIRLAPMGTSKYSTEIVDSIKQRVFFFFTCCSSFGISRRNFLSCVGPSN
jgi:hypothetical protein